MVANCRIYYSCNAYPNWYVDVPIHRWDCDNWGGVIEFSCTSSQRDDIFHNIIPGAVTEQYNILGTPHFVDISYESGNTLILEPLGGYGLSSNLRNRRIVGVKNANDSFLVRDRFFCKLEWLRLDI